MVVVVEWEYLIRRREGRGGSRQRPRFFFLTKVKNDADSRRSY